LSLFFTATLVLQLFNKFLFNMFAAIKVSYDFWTFMDLIPAIVNFIVIYEMRNLEVDQIIDPAKKAILNYYIIVALVFSWFRFLSYFLVIKQISKLFLTLFKILKNARTFIFIAACYLLIVSTIFTTLYSRNEIKFSSIFVSLRTLYDAMMAVYNYN